jgi:hypothetical protein
MILKAVMKLYNYKDFFLISQFHPEFFPVFEEWRVVGKE